MRIGILSYAHGHAAGYLHALRAIADVEIIGLADDDAERGREFTAQFSERLYPSFEALLADQPDGVIVTAENSKHLPLVKLAAEAGAHILCEKPLATTVADGQQMLDTCQRAGVQLMTAFPMRFSPPAQEVKQLMDGGRLGRILGFNATNNGQCPWHERPWFVDKALAGGGAMMDHVVHVADLLRWYLGREVVEVYAQSNHILYPEVTTGVETAGQVMVTFDNGTFASIDCSWSRPLYYPTWGGLTVELVGEGGYVTLDAFKQKATIYSHKRQRGAYGFWGSNTDQGMIEEFTAVIREGRAPVVTGYDGLKATEIVEAAYRSVETGAPVKLPLS